MGAYVLVLVNMPLMEFELCMFLPQIKNALIGPGGIGGRRQKNVPLVCYAPWAEFFCTLRAIQLFRPDLAERHDLKPRLWLFFSIFSSRLKKKRGEENENEYHKW